MSERKLKSPDNAPKTHALGYLRTSSATNAGPDKDSGKRQRIAIEAFAMQSGFVIGPDDWYYDEAVSGATELHKRPGWAAMMARIYSNGVRHIICESADRFARDAFVLEGGIRDLGREGVTLLTSKGQNLTERRDHDANMTRQIYAAFAEHEKARLVAKLKGSRDRKSAELGHRIEGPKPMHERRPEVVLLVKRLRKTNRVSGKQMSFRDIAEALTAAGHLNDRGKPFTAGSVKNLADGSRPPA